MKTNTNIQLLSNQMFHSWAVIMTSVLCAIGFGDSNYSTKREPKQLIGYLTW